MGNKTVVTITDDGDLRKYRTEVPNLIDDLALTPYQMALYTHYKRVCGAAGGECWEAVRTTAKKTKMSPAKVSLSRRELVALGLIRETLPENAHQGETVRVHIVDVWPLNFAYYSVADRPDVSGWSLAQLGAWLTQAAQVINGRYNTEPEPAPPQDKGCLPGKQEPDPAEDEGCLPPKQGVCDINGPSLPPKQGVYQVNERSNHIKKEPSEERTPKKKRPLTGRNAIKAHLEAEFSTLTGIPKPLTKTVSQRKKASVLWWKPLLELFDTCKGDTAKTLALMADTVAYFRAERLTLNNPKSILETARGRLPLLGQAGNGKSFAGGRGLDASMAAAKRALDRALAQEEKEGMY